VDGVRVNNRLYATTITDTLPASMVERIEVLKGGQSLDYGTQAAAGVINAVTRGYTDDFNGTVSVGADTNDSTHVDGYVRGAAGPGNYVLYASAGQVLGLPGLRAPTNRRRPTTGNRRLRRREHQHPLWMEQQYVMFCQCTWFSYVLLPKTPKPQNPKTPFFSN